MKQPKSLNFYEFEAIRAQFPALQRKGRDDRPCVYFDAPGGTQVPQPVIDAISNYLTMQNANTHGQFITSRESDRTIEQARIAAAELLGAAGPETIHFGANMSTITFHLSRALVSQMEPGDEIIVTHLDHDANISPWLALQKFGIKIKWLDFDPVNCTLQLADLPDLISPRTKLIAAGYASNAVGTINNAQKIVSLAHEAGALAFIDAVHFAPHGLIDVAALDCDFLLCSAYKFFGPHLGMAYIKNGVAENLAIDRVRPQDPNPPEKFETGTLNHEGLAGLIAAINYLAGLSGYAVNGSDRRIAIKKTMLTIAAYERELSAVLISGLQKIPGVKIHGITDPEYFHQRTPTVSITVNNMHPLQVAKKLGEQDIFVWDGDFFAIEVIRRLGLEKQGGLIRIGLTHYNTTKEIKRFLNALKGILTF